MRRTTAVLALLTVGLLPATGSAAGCAAVTDPAGDVTLAGAPASWDSHVDLVGARVAVVRGHLVATLLATDLVGERLGEWRVELTAGRDRLVLAAGKGMWVNTGDYSTISGFLAGRAGQRLTTVGGSIDYAADTIVIEAPLSVFGGPVGAVTAVTARAWETYHSGPAPGVPPLQALDELSGC